MSIFLITYYLKEEQQENCGCGCGDNEHDHEEEHEHYHIHLDEKLIALVRSLGTWAHFMPTSFLLKCELSAGEILEKLKEGIKEKDLLFVTKVEADTCASINPEVISWIKQ